VAVVRGSRVEPVRGAASITEEVGGRRFRISGLAFFQNNTDGAERRVELVTEAAAVVADDVLLDGYAGGGLFGATVGAPARRVVAVETGRDAVRDLKRNLKAAGIAATVIGGDFTEVPNRIDEPWTVAVVDPPRKGLGAEGVGVVTAAMPSRIVYVSCDPASLARDTRMLVSAGYRLDWAAPVDMFPQTHHVETVARFLRDDPEPDVD
jgi:23S rRNA (uracil1939-C5)-methyltransferase